MEWKPNLTCPALPPAFYCYCCVAGVGQQQCLRFSLGTGIWLLMWYRGDFLMKKWAKSKKYGKETFLTFPLQTLLSIAVRMGRMKVVSPHSVWEQRYQSWQGWCIRIWLENIKEKNQRKNGKYFSHCVLTIPVPYCCSQWSDSHDIFIFSLGAEIWTMAWALRK